MVRMLYWVASNVGSGWVVRTPTRWRIGDPLGFVPHRQPTQRTRYKSI